MSIISKTNAGKKEKSLRKLKPASALHIFHELRDDILTEVTTEVSWVELHVPLQYYMEEHLFCFVSPLFLYISLLWCQWTGGPLRNFQENKKFNIDLENPAPENQDLTRNQSS